MYILTTLQKVDDAVKFPEQTSNAASGLPSCDCKLKYRKKKMRTNRRKKGLNMSFMRAWNVDGALVKPKGMTRNS
jgi:hypothetical protein